MNQYLWKVLPQAPAELLSGAGQYPPLLVQLLYNRGLTHPTEWDAFLSADRRLCADPLLLPEVEVGVPRLVRALNSREKIAVYGDYDTDGVTATAVLVQGLEGLGAELIPYIPHRQEGHGLQVSVLERLYRQGATLVITADCGTTCYEEVSNAQKRGQDIIITDHHTFGDARPPAVALINPKHPDSCYPFRELAGVGVAYKFLQALLRFLNRDDSLSSLCDLVALGTVTDVAPLRGENRYLVKEGLKCLNGAHRPGLREMMRLARLETGTIDADDIAWVLGPRLNAAGRVEHASLSYQLLVTPSAAEGQRIASELEKINQERQRQTETALVLAREMAQEQRDAPLILVSHQQFPAGVAGLVAGKLVEELRRPAMVVRYGTESCRGSCRSIPEFDMIAALKECSDLLSRYGGHPMAAGFTLPTSRLPELQQRLVDKAAHTLSGLDLRPQLVIDAQMPLDKLDGEACRAIQKLVPFGFGNPAPTFLSPAVKVVGAQAMGQKGTHLRLKVKAGSVVWDAIAFDWGHLSLTPPCHLDLVYSVGISRWGGQERLELNIRDLRPTG